MVEEKDLAKLKTRTGFVEMCANTTYKARDITIDPDSKVGVT